MPYPGADRRGARALPRGERRRRARAAAARPDVALANHLVMGPVILRAGSTVGALRGEGPRQRARVHGAPHPERFLPYALEGLGRRSGRAGGLAPHRRESLSRCWPTSRRCRSAPASGRPAWTSTRSGPREPRPASALGLAADRGRLGRRAGRRRRCSASSTRRGPDRELRGQADRLEGRGPAAGGLAARGEPRARRAPRDRRLRHLPRRAGALRGGARRAATSRRSGTSPPAGASSRAARRASCAT